MPALSSQELGQIIELRMQRKSTRKIARAIHHSESLVGSILVTLATAGILPARPKLTEEEKKEHKRLYKHSNKCVDCGKSIRNESTRCWECYIKSMKHPIKQVYPATDNRFHPLAHLWGKTFKVPERGQPKVVSLWPEQLERAKGRVEEVENV